MILKRREMREVAVQTLYQVDMSDVEWPQALDFALEGRSSDPFLERLLEGTIRHREKIDQHIEDALIGWHLSRLSKVDHAILRLAVYELLFDQETPAAVVINEAVELGKTFGTEKNGKFINGVLANIKRQGAE